VKMHSRVARGCRVKQFLASSSSSSIFLDLRPLQHSFLTGRPFPHTSLLLYSRTHYDTPRTHKHTHIATHYDTPRTHKHTHTYSHTLRHINTHIQPHTPTHKHTQIATH